MESATILTPRSTGLSGIQRYLGQVWYLIVSIPDLCTLLTLSEPNIFPKDQNMKKNINTISMHGEKFYQLDTETTTAVPSSNDYFLPPQINILIL